MGILSCHLPLSWQIDLAPQTPPHLHRRGCATVPFVTEGQRIEGNGADAQATCVTTNPVVGSHHCLEGTHEFTVFAQLPEIHFFKLLIISSTQSYYAISLPPLTASSHLPVQWIFCFSLLEEQLSYFEENLHSHRHFFKIVLL